MFLLFALNCLVFVFNIPIGNAEEKTNPFLWRGTKWCGIGNGQHDEKQTKNVTGTDLCCKEHDSCPFYIPRWQRKYNYFNWRLYTISSCSCDNKFRKCLQNETSILSKDITRIYYHMLKVPCFKIKLKKN